MPADSKWPFYPLVGGHQQPLKGSLNHPKKVTKNCQVMVSFKGNLLFFLVPSSGELVVKFWEGFFWVWSEWMLRSLALPLEGPRILRVKKKLTSQVMKTPWPFYPDRWRSPTTFEGVTFPPKKVTKDCQVRPFWLVNGKSQFLVGDTSSMVDFPLSC